MENIELEIVRKICQACKIITKHKILEKYIDYPPEEYEQNADIRYFIVRCLGCDSISFRKEFHDFDNYYYDDEFDHYIDITDYPNLIEGYLGIIDYRYIPEQVKNIYLETLNAIQNSNFILAGIGLRTIIEAISNEQQTGGKNLSNKINKLHQIGMLSKQDTNRLHAIRFMGNDAAHEGIKYNKDQVLLAFEIIEHVLKSLYIFDKTGTSKLELPINNYNDFKNLISELCYKKYSLFKNQIFILKSLIDKDIRRLINIDYTIFENDLKTEIENRKFLLLIVEKEENNKVFYRFNPNSNLNIPTILG